MAYYNGKEVRLNTPKKSTRKDKKRMVYVRDKDGSIKVIHYGEKGYTHNRTQEQRRRYIARASKIRDNKGNLTADNPTTANYWAIHDFVDMIRYMQVGQDFDALVGISGFKGFGKSSFSKQFLIRYVEKYMNVKKFHPKIAKAWAQGKHTSKNHKKKQRR